MGAIGRVGLEAVVLHHLKPFMVPIHAWVPAGNIGSVLPLPRAIFFLVEWIAMPVVLPPSVTLWMRPIHMGKWFRAEAKVAGRWEVKTSGGDPSEAACLSVVRTPETAPWALCKGGDLRGARAAKPGAHHVTERNHRQPGEPGGN